MSQEDVGDKPIRLFIAMPCFGNMVGMNTVVSLVELLNMSQVPLLYEFLGNESLITRARNRLTHRFLQSDSTHLLWVDADIGFKASDVFRLLDADRDVIAGAYTTKQINWESVRKACLSRPDASSAELELAAGSFAFGFDPRDVANGIRLNQPCRVTQVGTGFMMIKRHVFELLDACPGVLKSFEPSEGAVISKYWRTGPNGDGIELSEDYFFSYMCRSIGIDTFILPDIVLDHTGSHVFKGSMPFIAGLKV